MSYETHFVTIASFARMMPLNPRDFNPERNVLIVQIHS